MQYVYKQWTVICTVACDKPLPEAMVANCQIEQTHVKVIIRMRMFTFRTMHLMEYVVYQNVSYFVLVSICVVVAMSYFHRK